MFHIEPIQFIYNGNQLVSILYEFFIRLTLKKFQDHLVDLRNHLRNQCLLLLAAVDYVLE